MPNVFYCLEISIQKEGLRKMIWHHSLLERKWRKNSFKKRENEKKAGWKYQELICRHSPKRSWEAMEGMKLVMEISIRGKHLKNAIFKKSSRQSGRGAVRIHKAHVSTNLQQPPAPVPVTPRQHPCFQGAALRGQKHAHNTKSPPKKRKSWHPFSMAPGWDAVTRCIVHMSEPEKNQLKWCWKHNSQV